MKVRPNLLDRQILLEDRVIDYGEFQVRRKTTDADLEQMYDEFVDQLPRIEEDFLDKQAFGQCMDEVGTKKRPKIITREVRRAPFHLFQARTILDEYAHPEKRRLDDRYFQTPHIIIRMPSKGKVTATDIHGGSRLMEDIERKFQKYHGYEGIIEIPNNHAAGRAKGMLFHEAVHYLLARYAVASGRTIGGHADEVEAKIENHALRKMIINEAVTNFITDKLLSHDQEAQFEGRYLTYQLMGFQPVELFPLASAAATGLIIGVSAFNAPYLFPLAIIPGRISDYLLLCHKRSKKGELLSCQTYRQLGL